VSEAPAKGKERGRPVRKTIRWIITVLLIILAFEYLVLPQIAGARKALSLLADLNLALVALALFLEAGSLLSYAQLTRSVLPATSRPGLFTTLRIDLATLSVSHLVPGGSAASTGIGFKLLLDSGVAGADAGFALGIQGIGSAAVLNVLLWLSLVVSIPLHGFNPLYVTAAGVGAVLIGIFSGLIILLVRGEEKAASAFRSVARRTPILKEDTVDALVHRIAARLRALASDPRLLWSAVGWAAGNWLLDAACLWVFLAAFGHRAPVEGLLVSYGLANVLAAIPITPGGLGVVEAVLVPSLVGFGVPRGVAILGVLGYRLVNFWLPIPLGALAYVSLRTGRKAPREVRARELRRLTERAVDAAEGPKEWAARHGIALESADPSSEGGTPTN
jgi:uncharacterized protein (TIRG00374 family)